MGRRVLAGWAGLALLGALTACDRADPPSKQIERAAEEIVTGTPQEQLPDQVQDGPLAPRNECRTTQGAPEFLAQFGQAVRARDADALVALAADDVKLDFGGGAGKALLRERLADEEGRLWTALEELLELGCASDGEAMITLPWYFEQDYQVPGTEGLIVTGEDVAVRSAPAADAPVVGRISWDAVRQDLDEPPPSDSFRKVLWTDPATQETLEGYIAEESLRAIIDYRISAARRNDRWRIVSFLAGD